MSSGQSSPMESNGGGGSPCPHADDGAAPPAVSAKKVWRAMQAAYLVVVKKHQPKLTALGVHLHHLLSTTKKRNHRRRSLAAPEHEHPALTFLSSSLSCRSMDPGAAVVHPYPRGHRHGRASSSSRPAATALSCRSMDPAAAVYQYRPREVEFSCKSTPLHKRRRRERRLLRLQDAADQRGRDGSSETECYYGSAMAVTRLFELMDVEEEESKATDLVDYDEEEGELDLEATVAWPALTVGPAPRQVRITDSPYMMWDDDSEEGWGAVDRRADEFIMRFHEQLRAQQPQRSTRYLVR